VLKEIREKIGKDPGDEVLVTVEEDTEPRVVDVRPDLKEALGKYPKAEAFFQLLSYTHQREYVRPWRCSRTARRNGSLDPWTGETAE